MSNRSPVRNPDLAHKIARLVEEKGWNQEDFARFAQLNRHTVRLILHGGEHRRLRNATVSHCADAFGLTVSELRNWPLERLLARIHGKVEPDADVWETLYDQARHQILLDWLERNRQRASQLRPEQAEELLQMQGPNGPMLRLGVDACVDLIERRSKICEQVRQLADSEFLPLLEQLVALMWEKHSATKPDIPAIGVERSEG
ncbi:helix-turn-helix domain-containing protein [Tuwongella immobilis]|uniref:Xre family transcriptional regulator n=1 Tax=Tuwongella immobilis TaxID=692036 RepID=A0A6C2YT83_9BACT|nr:hypothetical protein [Tuwongella immobilis]VIP04614.1 xre family transcriptional regulator : [Tuwongella immobilis]VTS06589.1 xre family transcriptional regulator : [Tuwongella immobilis]